MTDVLFIEFAYPDGDPDSIIDDIAEWFEKRDIGTVSVYGPRDDFGVTELDLSYDFGPDVITVSLDAITEGAVSHLTPGIPGIELQVATDEFTVGDTEATVRALVTLVTEIYNATDPAYVYGIDPFHAAAIGEDRRHPFDDDALEDQRPGAVTWLMLLPPAMVDDIGRSTVTTLPAWSVRELDDGTVIVVATGDPSDPENSDYTELREKLGIER